MILTINWEGPYSLPYVIAQLTDGGKPPEYEGPDYGVYQIYGDHILNGADTLLYVGKATKQRFSTRFKQHDKWLKLESNIQIYIGRGYAPNRHTEKDDWETWNNDLELTERIIINKYSPNYNSSGISRCPDLGGYRKITLKHKGQRHRLQEKDIAPEDLI